MIELTKSDPDIWSSFLNSFSACQNSVIPFTAREYDQAGEYVNRELKVEGGLIGVSNNLNTRTKFMITALI